jgi:hypothetical protein
MFRVHLSSWFFSVFADGSRFQSCSRSGGRRRFRSATPSRPLKAWSLLSDCGLGWRAKTASLSARVHQRIPRVRRFSDLPSARSGQRSPDGTKLPKRNTMRSANRPPIGSHTEGRLQGPGIEPALYVYCVEVHIVETSISLQEHRDRRAVAAEYGRRATFRANTNRLRTLFTAIQPIGRTSAAEERKP